MLSVESDWLKINFSSLFHWLQDKGKVVSSQLALVDLAGSERLARTKNQNGERLREAGQQMGLQFLYMG